MSRSEFRPWLVGNRDQATKTLSASTQVFVGSDRLARVSVTTAGAAGNLYDSATMLASARPI